MKQAHEIRKSKKSLSKLAKEYNVGATTIADIKKGRKYAK